MISDSECCRGIVEVPLQRYSAGIVANGYASIESTPASSH